MNSITFNEALEILGAYLADKGLKYELAAIGGDALLLLGRIIRPTRDLDIVALVSKDKLISASPLPLLAAIKEVGLALKLPEDWVNSAPAEHAFSQFVAALNSISSAKWLNVKEPIHFQVKISGKSSLSSLESPSLLMIRLRSLLGPGAKADILTYFLTRNRMHFSASDLVEIGYSKRSLIVALDHLTAAGILAATNVRNKKKYELTKIKEFQVLIGKLPEIAPPWNKILRAITEIRSILPEIQNSSEITKGILLRNCLIKLEPLLQAFISPILSTRACHQLREMSDFYGFFHWF